MNRRFLFLVGGIALLIIGGGLTSFITAEGAGNLIPGVLATTREAEGSVSAFGGNQGLQFVLMVGFIVFNLIGASLTGMAIFWFLNREVTRVKAEEPANHATIGEAFGSGRNRDDQTTTPELTTESGNP